MDQWEISIRKLLINGAITSFTEISDFWGFLAFQNGIALKNRVKIGGVVIKNMWSFEKYGKFHTFLFFIFDTFPNSLKMLKTDFEDLKAKMVIAMYSSTFGGKIQKQDFRVSNSLYLGKG